MPVIVKENRVITYLYDLSAYARWSMLAGFIIMLAGSWYLLLYHPLLIKREQKILTIEQLKKSYEQLCVVKNKLHEALVSKAALEGQVRSKSFSRSYDEQIEDFLRLAEECSLICMRLEPLETKEDSPYLTLSSFESVFEGSFFSFLTFLSSFASAAQCIGITSCNIMHQTDDNLLFTLRCRVPVVGLDE